MDEEKVGKDIAKALSLDDSKDVTAFVVVSDGEKTSTFINGHLRELILMMSWSMHNDKASKHVLDTLIGFQNFKERVEKEDNNPKGLFLSNTIGEA